MLDRLLSTLSWREMEVFDVFEAAPEANCAQIGVGGGPVGEVTGGVLFSLPLSAATIFETSLLERFILAKTAARLLDDFFDFIGASFSFPFVSLLFLVGDLLFDMVSFLVSFLEGDCGGDWTLLCRSPSTPREL